PAPVHGLEHAGVAPAHVQVAAGGQPDAAGHGRGQVGQDVAEQVVGDDHVEPGRVLHQEDGRGVDVQVVGADLRVLGGHGGEDPLPEPAGVHQHVVLVHQGHLVAAPGGALEGVPYDALDAVRGVDAHLGGDLGGGAGTDDAAVADVQALGAFADDDEVDLTLGDDRRGQG